VKDMRPSAAWLKEIRNASQDEEGIPQVQRVGPENTLSKLE